MLSFFEKITDPFLIIAYLVLCFASFALSILIIIFSKYGFTRRAEMDEMAVQSAHRGFIPRAGGIAVFVSMITIIPLSKIFGFNIGEMAWLFATALIVFMIGVKEDLGYQIRSKTRLLASLLSGSCVILFFNVWLHSVAVPGLDFLLNFSPFAIAFTLFATTGVVNGFNLIDGVNGLSSYVSISTALTLSILAFFTGHFELAIFLFLLSGTILGFFIVNFPFGKIFLGDGGAYLIGHILVWSSIILINFEPKISPFAILLIFFWPVADTLLSIWRRWKLGNPADRPDRLHFHQLIMRFLEIRLLGRSRRNIANPVVTIILIPLVSVPQIIGIIFWQEINATICFTVAMSVLFIFNYGLALNLAKRFR